MKKLSFLTLLFCCGCSSINKDAIREVENLVTQKYHGQLKGYSLVKLDEEIGEKNIFEINFTKGSETCFATVVLKRFKYADKEGTYWVAYPESKEKPKEDTNDTSNTNIDTKDKNNSSIPNTQDVICFPSPKD